MGCPSLMSPAAFATGYKMHVFDNAGRCLTDTLVPNCAGTVRCVLGFNLYILLGMPPRGGATITFKVGKYNQRAALGWAAGQAAGWR